MTDRWDDVAREIRRVGGLYSRDERVAAALRSAYALGKSDGSKAWQEDMRERAAVWHDEIAAMTNDAVTRRRHRRYATALRNIPIKES